MSLICLSGNTTKKVLVNNAINSFHDYLDTKSLRQSYIKSQLPKNANENTYIP